ncbi:MAG TPA: glycosyltransferase family 4 protein, partial [Clostridia bacterium]|nr:glycosyltransferase family 4 protein [Clostridia bacterium]
SEDVPYVFVKTVEYTGNSLKRINNMITFYRNLFPVAREYAKTHGKPDVILASSVHPLTLVAGIKIARKFRVPCICEVRDLWPETLVAMGRIRRNSIPARLLYALEKYIYRYADRLIFTFEGGADYVEGIGLDSSKVRYINNGIDLKQFHENKLNYIYSDAALDDKGTFKVIYTGSMGQANALHYLVEAAQIIQNKGIEDIKFILFGDGYQRGELERYVKVNNLSNIYFKGRVEKKYIPGILDKGNLNVFTGQHIPLYKYGLSLNKMFDYLASGKPIVSNIECGYDILEKYQCGITVQGGSPESLAKGILEFYNMPKREYETYCKNAVLAAEDYDFKTLTDKLEKAILEVG